MKRFDLDFLALVVRLSGMGEFYASIGAATRTLTQVGENEDVRGRRTDDLGMMLRTIARSLNEGAEGALDWLGPDYLNGLAQVFRQNDLPMCALLLEDEAKRPRQKGEFLRELQGEISRELRSTMLMLIPSDRVQYYCQPELFGPEVAERFGEARTDIEEAGNCLAADRGTAAVFHLMRVLEVAIRAISKNLGIPDPVREADRNWVKMLGSKEHPAGIWKELDRRNRENAPEWKEQRAFYDNIYVDLCAVRTAWRNQVMHVEGEYDYPRALHIFNVVRGFMQHLGERIGQAPKDS